MTREVAQDFERLEEFLRQYELESSLSETEYITYLSVQHKKYFALLTWAAEFKSRIPEFQSLFPTATNDICGRITESISDLGSALFNWVHGNYKASRVMIRVAIENYVRAVSAIWVETQQNEGSVYRMFDVAGSIANLSTSNATPMYSNLHQQYKELCKDTHTSTVLNMANLSCLADLPAFNLAKAKSCSDVYVSVTTSMLLLNCVLFNAFYQSFHYENKLILLAAVPSSKRILLSVDNDAN